MATATTEKSNDGATISPASHVSGVIDQGSFDKVQALPAGHDDALELFNGHLEDFDFTSKEANWVRWKLDLILLPLVSPSGTKVLIHLGTFRLIRSLKMTMTYILNYMDKVALSEASIFGIQESLVSTLYLEVL
jgi:hypothetical protein